MNNHPENLIFSRVNFKKNNARKFDLGLEIGIIASRIFWTWLCIGSKCNNFGSINSQINFGVFFS